LVCQLLRVRHRSGNPPQSTLASPYPWITVPRPISVEPRTLSGPDWPSRVTTLRPEALIGYLLGNSDQEEDWMLKRGEVVGVWVWGIVVWMILAFAFGDFWWFRPLYRQFF